MVKLRRLLELRGVELRMRMRIRLTLWWIRRSAAVRVHYYSSESKLISILR